MASVLGIMLLLAAMGTNSSELALVELAGAVIMLVTSAIFFELASKYLRLKKIRDDFVWLGSVAEDYLSGFPPLR